MGDTTDLKKGYKLIKDGAPWVVAESQFVKPGKGQAFFRTKLKHMMTGRVVDHTYKSGEKIEKADTEERTFSYLYPQADGAVFMDSTTYDQITLTNEQLGDTVKFLLDGTEVDIMFWDGAPIGVTPPNFVNLKVTETEPGFKGDTSSNTTKPATTETGLVVNVPLFVDVDDVLKVDTRTGDYVERVKQ